MTFYPSIVTTIEELGTLIKSEGLPDDMTVEIAEGVSIVPKTVRELRDLTNLGGHEKLRILVPRPRFSESVVKIELPD